MMDLNVLYKNLVDEYSLNIVSLKKQLFWVATIRLIMFASLLTSIYLLLHTGNFYWGIASLVFITGFLYLVKQSARLNAQKLLNEHLLFINQNELNVLKLRIDWKS